MDGGRKNREQETIADVIFLDDNMQRALSCRQLDNDHIKGLAAKHNIPIRGFSWLSEVPGFAFEQCLPGSNLYL